ncbi:nucleoporin subcomplex protein binding to Pom34-domain-containing protein [Lasiosphaeria ovina]|uniref:Nucleoporin NUP188 n=1 Tax=Lasiosphaeria ovina TaxID=92902 RepID=A0AAE0NF94_9PEZI|nr:nucleoporin subcomplex protein binding to Pom34-domain-containing protein [Lasiosphaeria ovina]
MASLTDRTYFPNLEECLSGKRCILSWGLVASALDDSAPDRVTSAAVSAFLRDGYVHHLIKTPSAVFEPPTAKSKTDFETKTAAINVIPAPNDRFTIGVIKEDALWLSENVNINEVAALRIVAIEFQVRAQSHLTGPLSSQDVVNIQEAAGVTDAQASSILAILNVSAATDAEATWADFETQTSRRRRLLTTYLSERRSFLGAADSLASFLLHSRSAAKGPEVDELRRIVAKAAFNFDELNSQPDVSLAPFEALVPSYLAILGHSIARSQTGPGNVTRPVLTEQIEVDWLRTCLTEAVHAMSLVFQILDLAGAVFATPDLVAQWFAFVDSCEFLESLNASDDALSELVMPLRSMICVISLKLLNADRSILYLNQEIDLMEHEDPYLASSEVLTQIHQTLQAAASAGSVTASPVVLAWSLILHTMYVAYQERTERRDFLQNQRAQEGFELEIRPSGRGRRNSTGSIVSLEQSPYDLFLASQSLDRDIAAIENLAIVATSAHGQIYESISDMSACLGNGAQAAFRPAVGGRGRLTLQELLKTSFKIVGYRTESLSSLLSVLSAGGQYWDISLENSLAATQGPAAHMLENTDLRRSYLNQAITRYPYEFLPFANFCRVLSASLLSDPESSELVMGFLHKTPSLMLVWKHEWTQYELVSEEENTNSFRLTEDLDLFNPTWASKRRPGTEEAFFIPSGTLGRFVTTEPRIALLEFEHSALALLGKRLETNLMPDASSSGLGPLAPEEVAEGVSLLATVLGAQVVKVSGPGSQRTSESAIDLLKEASRTLPRNRDIITVICDTLDGLIQEELTSLDSAKIATMSSCIQFLHAALSVCPGRIWGYVARCGLVNSETRSGRLSRITGNIDMSPERFDFLSSAVKLFSSLIDSAMISAVQRKAGTTLYSRSKGDETPWLGTSEKTISRVSLLVAQTAVDVFENSATWRFPNEVDRSILVRDVLGILNNLISYSFSIGTAEKPSSLTSCLVPAAKYILDGFLSPSSSSLRFQPFLATLLVAFQIPDSTLYVQRSGIVSERLTAALAFANTLLRAANYLNQPSAVVQTQLFKSASLIARLPGIKHSFKAPAVSLLSALVESAGKGSENEPPSLLGYLGPQVSRSFLQIVSQLDQPYDRISELVSMWKFFSTIMRNRQQWMANCLLTGKTPREALKGDGKMATLSPDSVLAMALEKLCSVNKLPSRESMAVLEFFTSAQNYWPWTIFAMQKDNSFLQHLRSYARNLKSPSVVSKTDAREAGYQARIAAYIAETFAMQLYHLRQIGQEQTFATDVLKDLDYFLRNGAEVADYNASLHANFTKNFNARYSGCSIDDFKRTALVPRDLGSNFYFALDFADTMLGYDAGWTPRRQNGFRHEMETANLNLSLVEAEVALFHAWEYLLLELSVCLLPNGAVAQRMLQVAEQCLESNQRPQPPENIFVRLSHSRANLTLTLLQRLADCSYAPKNITSLLMSISATINGVEDPFSADRISYFRTLLKILFMILRGAPRHSAGPAPSKGNDHDAPVALTQTVLTILDRVVARLFRLLVTLVHEPKSATTPEDLALVTAILQACLSVSGIEQCQLQIGNIMASYDVFQVATSLFSWADKLADNGDPVYGELALLFLLELSALPTIAEQLACDGLLGHLTSASLAGYMRRSNVSPFSENAGAARCYGIWAKGVLPLLLNILGALRATIAPEIAFVLNQFPNLLQSSVERFEAPGLSRTASRDAPQFVTLVGVSEMHSLALLTRVLGVLRANNTRDIPEVAWDAASVLENVEFWLRSRKILRERMLPLGPRETEWRATKAADGSGCENRLEEKAVSKLEAVKDVLAEDME